MHYRRFQETMYSASASGCLLALIVLSVVLPASARGQRTDGVQSASQQVDGPAVVLSGHTVRSVVDGTSVSLGHYNPDQKLRLALGLKVPHMAEEEKFLIELQQKGSPNFHKFLSAEQWNQRFGPSVEDEQKIVDWALSQGMTITHRFDNRLLVDVEAPAGVIEKALSITLNQYQHENEVDFANDRDPQIPARLSGILESVAGLNSMERFYRVSSTRARTKGPDYVAGPAYSLRSTSKGQGDPTKAPARSLAKPTSPRPAFTNGTADPSDIPYSSESYDYAALLAQGHCCNPTGNPNGATPESSIAVMTYGNFQDSDVQGFFNTYGMAWYYYSYYIDGNAYPGLDDEAPLDVEYAGGTANSFGDPNQTAKVYVYEATNNLYSTYEDTFNFLASQGYAKVVTTSYGFSEDGFMNGNGTGIFTTMHGIFNSMNGQGITLISASGDNGATDDCTNAVRVHYPAADPDFIAAGGTQINLNSDGTFSSEVDWTGTQSFYNCPSNEGGGGGGYSAYQSAPSWQSFIGNTQRALPDISLNAATGQNYFYNGGLTGVGGTSIVAPELAGFFAQENSYLLAEGNICGSGSSACSPLGNPATVLYEDGVNNNAAHYPFYDVTSGCNSNYYTTLYSLGYYCAGTGFDEATGWGSFNALQLAWALNWEVIPAYGSPNVTWTGPATNTWYNTNQTVSWAINDYQPANTYPGTGIAGETQGWDGIPADPSGEPSPGSGNSFYSGPQFPNGSTGCLAFEANGCSGGVSQGCHYAFARGWNNQGFSTANQSSFPEYYGPLCYDTVAPNLAVGVSPSTTTNGWYNKLPVTVTLSASDPGGSGASGVAQTFYAYDFGCNTGAPGNCAVYSGPLVFNAQGATDVISFAEDHAGNFSSTNISNIFIDTTAPVTGTGLSGTVGSGGNYVSKVTITLNRTDNLSGVAATYYTLDGSAQQTYGGAIGVSALGTHKITVHSVDIAGNVEAARTTNFTIYTPTVTTLAASLNPSLHGQNVTLTAHVAAVVSGTPAGKVIFKDGSNILATETLTGGAATLVTSNFALGANSLSASYAATGFDEGSASAVLTETVHETTTTTISSSEASATFGTPVTLTATVKASISGIPTGPVVFYDGATSLGSVNVNASGVASLSTSKLIAGVNAVHAAYSGSTIDAASSSANVNVTVTPASTTIALKASATKIDHGASVAFTATVTSPDGTPAGTINFLNNGIKLGSINVTAGSGIFNTTALPVGDDSVVAEYAGDADFKSSNSATVTVLTDATTTTTLSTSANPATFGESVTLRAVVIPDSGAAATGIVTFKNGTTILGTGTLVSAAATLTTTKLPLGLDQLTAVYDGSTYVLTSTSPVVHETVNPAPTAIALKASSTKANYGTSISFTATITSAGGTPSGTINFLNRGVKIGSINTTTGSGTFATTALPVGTNSIVAEYAGDADFKPVNSAALSVVTDATTTTTLTASPNPSNSGQFVTLKAVVKPDSGAAATGTVTFKNGTAVLGTGTLVSGTATLTTAKLPVGNDELTAVYGGSTYDLTSTSPAVKQVVK